MSEENKDEVSRRQTRIFIYQDEEHVVAGRQYVRYEPDVKKNIFGTTKVETIFPTQKEMKNSFPLNMYPEVLDANADWSVNIMEDPAQGVRSLFIESNRAAGLLVRSIAKIPSAKFSYDNLRIFREDQLQPKQIGTSGSYDMYTLSGVVRKKIKYLRKGDIVDIGTCDVQHVEGSKTYVWQCRYIPEHNKFPWWEPIRRAWLKLTNAKMYKDRYINTTLFGMEFTDVKITSGDPVEETTARSDD